MNRIDRLVGEWKDGGIERGDLVMLHSHAAPVYRRFRALGERLETADLLQSFLRAVGPDGGLLFPAFRYDFADGVPFDMRTSPSGMGALSEAARIACGRHRTGHPFYSFSCFGHRTDTLHGRINRDAFGSDSPFALLHQAGGKVAILDLDDQHSVTFYHYVEQAMNVPYRFKKEFTGPHINLDGVEQRLTFKMLVRDLKAGVVTDVNPMGALLWEKSLYHGSQPGKSTGLRTIAATDLFDATAEIINQGRAPGMLYRIENTANAHQE